jgi:hypothetical protein
MQINQLLAFHHVNGNEKYRFNFLLINFRVEKARGRVREKFQKVRTNATYLKRLKKSKNTHRVVYIKEK